MDNQNSHSNYSAHHGPSGGHTHKTNVSLYVCDIPQNITKEELD